MIKINCDFWMSLDTLQSKILLFSKSMMYIADCNWRKKECRLTQGGCCAKRTDFFEKTDNLKQNLIFVLYFDIFHEVSKDFIPDIELLRA